MKKILSLIVTAALLSSCASAYQRPTQGDLKPVTRLAVVVTGEPEFKVLNNRATQPMAPLILFGAVGAVVMSTYNNSTDAEQEKKLQPLTTRISYRESFEKQLKKLLEDSKRFSEINFYDSKSVKGKSYDALLELSIQEWGIRVLDEHNDRLVPYMSILIRLTGKNGKTFWKEKDLEVGRSAHAVGEYLSKNSLLEETLQTVLKDSAYRIASTLIYS